MQDNGFQIFIITIVIITISILLLMFLLLGLLYIHQKKRSILLNEMQFLKAEGEKNLLYSQIEIQEQTFNYIAQEIHDHIAQRLTLARLYLNSRNNHSAQKSEELIEQSSEFIGIAIDDLKSLSRTLTSDFIRENGLIKAIEMEAERINKLHQLQIKLMVVGDTVFLPAETELVIFRIVQEALQNMMKHAQATEALIRLNYSEAVLAIQINDNGIGFTSTSIEKENHLGLRNMEKRTKMLLGNFNLHSQPTKGTTIQIEIPINQAISL